MKRAAMLTVILGALAGRAGAAGPTAYVADPAQSRLEFVGVQAGAPFTGVFHKFGAVIDFSPDALDASRFDVSIDVNSLDSMDQDRDGTMRGADLLDTAHSPTSRYVTRSVARTATGYSAVGSLTLRGVTRDVPIEFKFVPTPNGARLVGSATVKRLDFGVGRGDWKSTEWVGDAVKVNFALALKPKG